jgi:hypothetical protein
MRLRWPAFLTRFTALSASKYNRQSAPEFLFERRPDGPVIFPFRRQHAAKIR